MIGMRPIFPRVFMPAVLLLAFMLRVFRLDFQSFWSDEGISLLRSSLPLPRMLAEMPVEHVPGYFVLLAGWLRLTGTSDYALRLLSVWPSVLAVAVIYRLAVDLAGWEAQRWFGPAVGGIAALLLATGAFQVWYAQEARMYSWLLFGSLTATWLLWRMVAMPSRRPWLVAAGYSATLTLTIYLHFYGFLVPLAHTLFVLGWAVARREWRGAGRWLLCGVVVALLFLPWLPHAWAIRSFDGWRHPGEPAEIPGRFLAAFTAGAAMPPALTTWVSVCYLAAAALGTVIWARVRPAALWLLVTALLVPLAAILAYTLRNPDYHERYAIGLTAPLLLLAAGGVLGLAPRIWQRADAGARVHPLEWAAPVLVVVLLVGANGAALVRHYTDASLHKPDFRGAAWRIQHEEAPGDVVMVDGPDPEKVFLHYYTGSNPLHDLRFLDGASWDVVDAALREATAGADDAWEVLYFHPPGPVQVWLAVNGWASAPSDHNDIRVTRYGLPGPPLTSTQLDLSVGDALALESAEISAAPLAPGDLLRVSTHWFTHQPPPELKFSLRLLDDAGTVALAQDYVPQNGFAPTNVWIVDQPATDQRGIIVPPDLPPGRYAVALRLYDPGTGQAVATALGQDIPLGEIRIASRLSDRPAE